MRAYILHLVYRIGGEIPGIQDEDSGAALGGSIELARGSRYMAGMGHSHGASSTFIPAGVSGGEPPIQQAVTRQIPLTEHRSYCTTSGSQHVVCIRGRGYSSTAN